MSGLPNPPIWIGIDDKKREGDFRYYSDNSPIPIDAPIGRNQPNGNRAENCLTSFVEQLSRIKDIWTDYHIQISLFYGKPTCDQMAGDFWKISFLLLPVYTLSRAGCLNWCTGSILFSSNMELKSCLLVLLLQLLTSSSIPIDGWHQKFPFLCSHQVCLPLQPRKHPIINNS